MDIIDPPDFDKEQLLDIMADRLSGRGKITPEEDLIAIARVLRYKKIRKIGEMPENMGLFERVAPCQMSTDLEKQIKTRSGANNPRNIDWFNFLMIGVNMISKQSIQITWIFLWRAYIDVSRHLCFIFFEIALRKGNQVSKGLSFIFSLFFSQHW